MIEPSSKYHYQADYAMQHADYAFDVARKKQKAKKIKAILREHCGEKLKEMHGLDLGCSLGIISIELVEQLASLVAVDYDATAVAHATEHHQKSGLSFLVQDAMNLSFPDEHFDLVISNQVYEHVPDSARMFDEIHRVLKPGGICYLAAGNRFKFMEDHYRLPLLSAMPKSWGHRYLRVLGKGDHYYETHHSLSELKRQTARFRIHDYTLRVISEPEHFCATDMLRSGSLKQKAALLMGRLAYWLVPGYLWVLEK